MDESQFSKLIFDPTFKKVIDDLAAERIHANLLQKEILTFEDQNLIQDSNHHVQFIEDEQKYKVYPLAGRSFIDQRNICAYDESLVRISSLEGSGFLISHSLILMNKEQYLPLIYLTFHFYTKSKRIANGKNALSLTQDPPEVASKKQYITDRYDFLTKNVPRKSLLLIDGPLIGGQITEYNLQLNSELLFNDIIVLFIVKNSDSSIVIDSFPDLKDQYNSDFDWAFKILRVGERTSFIKYYDMTDTIKRRNKIFTYLKAFNTSPIRLELHESTYIKYREIINNVVDTVYFLLLAQGDIRNPQPRTIAIAEKYAREAINMISLDQIINKTGIMPTMNYTRFGW